MSEKKPSPWRSGIKVSVFVFVLCLAYAFLRYNVVRNVSLEHLPLYIVNKAVALATTFIIGFSYMLGPLARFFPSFFVPKLSLRKPFGLFGFGMAAVHAVMALLLFDKAIYPRFFAKDGQLTWQAETAMLFGVLAFFTFSIVAIVSIPSVEEKLDEKQWKTVQRLGLVAYFFVLLHAVVMGYRGWFLASSWSYGLASISLVASLFIVLVFLVRVFVTILPQKKTK